MKLQINDIGGNIIKQDHRYIVRDNNHLNNLVVSSTNLNPLHSTTGHAHPGQEEVYYFIQGHGTLELGNTVHEFRPGDVFLIENGAFHRVHAGADSVYFVCVFDATKCR